MNKYIMMLLCGLLSFLFLIFYVSIGDGNGIFNIYETIGLFGFLFSLLLMFLYRLLEDNINGGKNEK